MTPKISNTERILLDGYTKNVQTEKEKYEDQLFEVALLRAIREFEENNK